MGDLLHGDPTFYRKQSSVWPAATHEPHARFTGLDEGHAYRTHLKSIDVWAGHVQRGQQDLLVRHDAYVQAIDGNDSRIGSDTPTERDGYAQLK